MVKIKGCRKLTQTIKCSFFSKKTTTYKMDNDLYEKFDINRKMLNFTKNNLNKKGDKCIYC